MRRKDTGIPVKFLLIYLLLLVAIISVAIVWFLIPPVERVSPEK